MLFRSDYNRSGASVWNIPAYFIYHITFLRSFSKYNRSLYNQLLTLRLKIYKMVISIVWTYYSENLKHNTATDVNPDDLIATMF